MTESVMFCIAPNEFKAGDIVSRLKSAGFADRDISVLLPDRSGGGCKPAVANGANAPDGAAAGAGGGGPVGGALGLLAGIGMVAIPGVGPFIAAGPIVAAISGGAVGAGGIAGALVGMGIPEVDAGRYESHVRNGSTLISVRSEDTAQITKARDVFERSGATDLGSTAPASAPAARMTPAVPGAPEGEFSPLSAPTSRVPLNA